MGPEPVKKEEDVGAAIRKWKRELRECEMLGAPVMSTEWKKTAIMRIIEGQEAINERIEARLGEARLSGPNKHQ